MAKQGYALVLDVNGNEIGSVEHTPSEMIFSVGQAAPPQNKVDTPKEPVKPGGGPKPI